MTIETILILIWLHFLGDFLLQTNDMAQKKAGDYRWLLFHVGVYSIAFFYFGWIFTLVNFFLHLLTDFITARVSTKFSAAKNQRLFWITIGADQAIHVSTLFLTYYWLIL